jgi:hypothetical protein
MEENNIEVKCQDVLEALRLLQEKHPDGVLAKTIRDEFYPTLPSNRVSSVLTHLTNKQLVVRGNEVKSGRAWAFRYKLSEQADKPPEQPLVKLGGSLVNFPEPPHPDLPLLIEDVLSALESSCKESGEAISSKALKEKFFPAHSINSVHQLLNYLESTGKAASTKSGQTKLFHPSWLWAKKPTPPPAPFKIDQVPKKVLAFQCEVCQALVGLKAQETAFTVDCMGCGATYMAEKGWTYRLGQGIKVQVWTPMGVGA